MADTITTGIFGTLIVAILVYLVARVDRLADEVHSFGERIARIEGRLDEREPHHPR